MRDAARDRLPELRGHQPAGAKFCSECATPCAGAARPATTATPAAPAPPTATAMQPDAVAERRLVTVLFADLVGFTAFAEGRDAEEIRELQDRYFEPSARSSAGTAAPSRSSSATR